LALDEAYVKVYRHHSFHDSTDFVASLRKQIAYSDFKTFQEVG